MNKKVRKMIVASLNRSAIIAWEARPRIPEAEESPAITSEPGNRESLVMLNTPEAKEKKKEKEGLSRKAQSQITGGDAVVTVPLQSQWRSIAHNGWSSPLSPDLPNLQYSTVVLELPHLIEARAVSLAPSNPESPTDPTLPDIRAMDVLRRPTAMGLREYIEHLTDLGVIATSITTAAFLASYEFARFSGRPLTELQFRDLMKLFADLLRMMNRLSPAVLASLDIDPPESDIDEDGSTTSTPRSRSLVSSRDHSIRSESGGTVRTVPSRSAGVESTPTKEREKFSTAPATPGSKKPVVSRTTSLNSFSQSKRPYTAVSESSSSSLRSASQISVIKLSRSDESGDLPYTLTVPGTRHN